jgi:hypothetical protein
VAVGPGRGVGVKVGVGVLVAGTVGHGLVATGVLPASRASLRLPSTPKTASEPATIAIAMRVIVSQTDLFFFIEHILGWVRIAVRAATTKLRWQDGCVPFIYAFLLNMVSTF